MSVIYEFNRHEFDTIELFDLNQKITVYDMDKYENSNSKETTTLNLDQSTNNPTETLLTTKSATELSTDNKIKPNPNDLIKDQDSQLDTIKCVVLSMTFFC